MRRCWGDVGFLFDKVEGFKVGMELVVFCFYLVFLIVVYLVLGFGCDYIFWVFLVFRLGGGLVSG